MVRLAALSILASTVTSLLWAQILVLRGATNAEAQVRPDVVTAGRFVLQDPERRVRAALELGEDGAVALRLLDASGTRLVQLLGQDDGAAVTVFGPNGAPGAGMSVTSQAPSLYLINPNAQLAMGLENQLDSPTQLTLWLTTREGSTQLVLPSGASPRMELRGGAGLDTVWTAP